MSVQPNVSHSTHAALPDAAAHLEREIASLLLFPVGAVLVGLAALAMLVAMTLDAVADGIRAVFGESRRA